MNEECIVRDEEFPREGKAIPTRGKGDSFVWEKRFPRVGKTIPSCGNF